jgi:starch synthase
VRVLFAASEVAPLSKTGGLADVAQSLPKALKRHGHDVRVVTPAYPGLRARLQGRRLVGSLDLRGFAFSIWEGTIEAGGASLWLAYCEDLFLRDGSLYTEVSGREYADNALRFGLFSELVAQIALGHPGIGWQPDVVHLNDWHTGLAAAWLHDAESAPGTVFTIHNLAYQGNYAPAAVAALGLPTTWLTPAGMEFHGQVSFMKAGLVFADALTTVSPTYAVEIQTPEFGAGMDGVLRGRAAALTGILNGIDEETWNPATDPYIERHYDAADVGKGKRVNRRALRQRLRLADDNSLLAIYIGRLAHQKGVDLFLESAAGLDHADVQFSLLGAGDRGAEQAFAAFASSRPGRVAATFGYDEPLAHLMESAADVLLMPSRYEPCGLNQMYSQRYGTVPVVRRTGGLSDSVVDATSAALKDGTATGIVFDHPDAGGIAWGIERALELKHRPEAWRAMQRNGMRRDFSWTRTAGRYVDLYQSLGRRPVS